MIGAATSRSRRGQPPSAPKSTHLGQLLWQSLAGPWWRNNAFHIQRRSRVPSAPNFRRQLVDLRQIPLHLAPAVPGASRRVKEPELTATE
jgi:hypothetical protein